MPNERKIQIVSDLKEKFKKAQAVVFADYSGLGVNEMSRLRRNLSEVEAKLMVAKNTLIQRALTSNLQPLTSKLEGPTAVVFVFGDPLAAIKKLYDFIKETNLPEVKLGVFEGGIIEATQVEALSKIPSRKVLLGQLVGMVQSPVVRLVSAGRANQIRLVTVLRGQNVKLQNPNVK